MSLAVRELSPNEMKSALTQTVVPNAINRRFVPPGLRNNNSPADKLQLVTLSRIFNGGVVNDEVLR